MKRPMIGHVIRWVLIVLMGAFIFFGFYSFQPWSAESAIRESLHAMDLPGDVEAVSSIEVGKLQSVLFWDEQYQMYHHAWMKHSLGLFWLPQGGGFGKNLSEDKYKIWYGEGYSNRSNRSYHYIEGRVNDSRVATVEVLWADGTGESMEPIMGRLIHFAREGKAGESSRVSLGLHAYDADGELLYTLDSTNNSIPAD